MAGMYFDDVVGLEAFWFADEEMLGASVRLLVSQNLGGGYTLSRGECFRVVGICGRGRERSFLLSNHRADKVPVKACICELLLGWPANVERDCDGK